jgi:hypothetical protein
MTLAEWAQFAQAASIVLASLIALYGIDAWRREHVGKRGIELAEEVLAGFYRARDAIAQMRSPFGFGGEGETRKAPPEETPEQKAARDSAYVLIERYSKHSELFAGLHSLRYRFMATIGAGEAKPFDDLTRIINELFLAAQTKGWLDPTPEWRLRDEAAMVRHMADREKNDSIYYAGADPDPIEVRVNSLVADLERTCRAVIQAKGTLFGWLNWSRKKVR